MERKLATIETIQEIQPIPNADNIVKARVRNWWVVVGKDQFSPGDRCIYFEIDSLLPTSNPRFDGLDKYNSIKECNGVTGYRIRTVKMRGQISQGLALPYSGDLEQGTDVTVELGVVKYDPYEDPKIRLQSDNGAEGLFPTFIPKTDEERVQNLSIDVIKDQVFNMSEKLDGTSFTAYKLWGDLHVCSRNLVLREDASSIYWKIANQYDLKNVVPEGLAIQGEIVGEGIQGNPLKLKGQELYVFYMYDITLSKYTWLDLPVLKKVPIRGPYVVTSIEDLIDKSYGLKSMLNPNCQAEGIVYVNYDNGIKYSFKVINNKYLLKEK